jgi:tetratricopeptide (TPR) repeat protein
MVCGRDTEADFEYASNLFHGGRYQEASIVLASLIKREPSINPIVYENYAISLMRCGKIDEAIKAFDEALDKTPYKPVLLLSKGSQVHQIRVNTYIIRIII